ncbi:hypothetical protein G5T42_05020 [Microbacterium sp. 4R-513]|uniref:hypothetical protein n=1 Tax=Microbacterium sp. 4R-513 TaxID=2567934 RepID=UPI0013E208AA|nr:hypothetical protein [Microbacterium sp. 4R-513]QIG38925.1 hypothetical protein G5T42_05020 [Microbacterium sp. 4R-513]
MLDLPRWMDGVAFTNAEGRRVGLTDAELRRAELARPFHGVRVGGTAGRRDGGLIDRCSDLRVVLPADAAFSHLTAARLWGMPLPAGAVEENLHVLTPGSIPVRRAGVVGWVRRDQFDVRLLHGLPVLPPADAWAMLAGMSDSRATRLTREWLVAIGDFLISGRRTKWGREPALASIDDLSDAVGRHGSRRGAASLAWALGRVRRPVDSPPETFLRLGLVAARVPEPIPQPTIATSEGDRHPDLGYLAERVLLEYLGDVHRTDAATWRKDLTRVQLFQDAGYRVILVGADDVSRDGLPRLAARVRRALRGTSGSPRSHV